MLEYVIVGLLVTILLGLVLLGISLRKRKVGIDLTKLSEGISAKIREDIAKAVRETVSEVSERVGGVSGTLKSVVELFEKIATPEEMEELKDGFARGDADVIEKTGKLKEEAAKDEMIYESSEELKPENQNSL
jgi:hypothetical protein